MLSCRPLEKIGFVNGFSTRLGGVSPFPENDLNLAGFDDDLPANINENRRRFLDLFNDEYILATVWQVHGNDVRLVTSKKEAAEGTVKADAIVSDLSNALAAVKTADCVPILYGDRKLRIFAAAHAGWRGTVLGIASKTVDTMKKMFASKPSDIVCAIGPAAGRNRYEVGPEVVRSLKQHYPAGGKYFSPTHDGHALIDLHSANRDQLIKAGVDRESIFIAPFCTIERNDLFFSYRAEKEKYGKVGRLLSVIGRA